MSTSNFSRMKEGFPLIIKMEDEWKILDEDGFEIEFLQSECDAYLEQLNETVSDFSRDLKFHELSIDYGYYEGVQLWVEPLITVGELEGLTSADCTYDWGLSKSKLKRAIQSEKVKITRILHQIKDKYEMIEVRVSAQFSNGETWYEEV